MKLEEAINQVKPASREAAEAARKRWDSIAKPLNGLGVLEEDIVRIAAAQGRAEVSLEKRPSRSCARTMESWRKE